MLLKILNLIKILLMKEYRFLEKFFFKINLKILEI